MNDIQNRLRLDKRNDGIMVSTIKAIAFAKYGEYETAISVDYGERWRICKGYNTKEEALEWHEKFLEMSQKELLYFNFLE